MMPVLAWAREAWASRVAALVRIGWPRAHIEGAASRGCYMGETGQSK